MYAYALNNPTTLTDPLGLDSCPYTECVIGHFQPLPLWLIIDGWSFWSNEQFVFGLNHPGRPPMPHGPPKPFAPLTDKGKNRKVDQCAKNFYKTGPGKFAQLFSPLALVPGWNPDWSGNLKLWAEAVLGKGGGTSVMSRGEEIRTINGVTKIASPLEKVTGKIFSFLETTEVPVIGTATLMDIFAHQTCAPSQYPSVAGPGTVAF